MPITVSHPDFAAIRPDAVKLVLNEEQMQRAASMGCARQLAAIRKRRPGYYGNKGEDAWTHHIEGCGGEQAGCLYYGLAWMGYAHELRRNGVKLADGGEQVEFRTGLSYRCRLIVHPDDRDDRLFVLVVGRMPTYYIQGWIPGAEAKRDKWWEDPSGKNRPAYFVPANKLHPPNALQNRLWECPF